MITKKCTSCGRELSIDMFGVRSSSKDGHTNICKECKSKKDKAYREKNKDKLKEQAKQKRLENKEAINAKKRQYYQDHKEEILAKCAEYRKIHKEEKAKRDKEYAQQHKEKIQQYQQEYRAIHKLSNAEYQKQYRENNKERLAEYKKSPHVRYTVYQRNAKARDLGFELSEEEFIEISSLPCIYCGEYSDTYNNEPFNGIDRVDNCLGYQQNNCLPCCATCITMKLDYSVDEWINKMIQIINYYSSNI